MNILVFFFLAIAYFLIGALITSVIFDDMYRIGWLSLLTISFWPLIVVAIPFTFISYIVNHWIHKHDYDEYFKRGVDVEVEQPANNNNNDGNDETQN